MTTAPSNAKPTVREFYRDSRYASMGEQYNNLGNIMQGKSGMWPGQEGIGWNGDNTRALKAFATVEDGVAAQAFLLERYINRNGDRTFSDIISRYSPPNENDTRGYISHVAGNVDKIARGLGYTGPAITANTDLQKAFADKSSGDIILAATVKAMNEVEVGAASDRKAPAALVLNAVRNKYRKQYGSYEGYAHAIGQDPNIRAPGRQHNGVADTDDGDWQQPTELAIDDAGKQMMAMFVGMLLKALFPGLLKSLGFPEVDVPAPSTAAPAALADLDISKLVSQPLLRALGASGADLAARETQLGLFDLDHNGHITAEDLPLIRTQLQTSGVTVPATGSAHDVLTAYAQQLAKSAGATR